MSLRSSSKRGCGTPRACRVFVFPRKRHLRTVVVRSPQAFFSHRIQHEGRRRCGCHFGHLFSARGVFFASVTRAQSSRQLFESESRHKRATLEKGAPNTLREGGFCFASADTLKRSGGRVVGSSSHTSREGGSRFFSRFCRRVEGEWRRRGGEQVQHVW